MATGGGRRPAAYRAPPATRRASSRCASCIKECARRGIEALTLFAFSSENWRRPQDEVSSLMNLFLDALDREIEELHSNRVRVRFIGDRKSLGVRLQARIAAAQEHTAANEGLKLQVAVSYGGRWDIVPGQSEACERMLTAAPCRPRKSPKRICGGALQLAGLPEPDLFIRTRRRATHQQFPAVEPGVHRAVFLRPVVAGFRRRRS